MENYYVFDNLLSSGWLKDLSSFVELSNQWAYYADTTYKDENLEGGTLGSFEKSAYDAKLLTNSKIPFGSSPAFKLGLKSHRNNHKPGEEVPPDRRNKDFRMTLIRAMTYALHDRLEEKDPKFMKDKQVLPLKAKVNSLHNGGKPNVQAPHIDFETDRGAYKNMWNVVYYINESDGDTYLFNQVAGEEFDKFTVQKKVTPKPNRAFIFSNSFFHSSSSPIKFPFRFAINLNVFIVNPTELRRPNEPGRF